MTTVSVENYLKAIYLLSQQEIPVKTKSIADAISVSLPSVTSMIQSLSSDEMVDYTPYKGVTLSEKGKRAALNVIRKHRLVEMFLVETLGYTWDEVHNEAEQLEHSVSNELARRIDDFLGNPGFDPHGDPIPTATGEVPKRDLIPLCDVLPSSTVRIARVTDQDPDVLRHLSTLGLVPDVDVEVIEKRQFDGEMTVRNTTGDHSVSQSLASRLLVTR